MTGRNFRFTDDRKKRAMDILERYPTARAAVLPMLWLVQEQEGWVPTEAVATVADTIGVRAGEVHEVMSFYTMFKRRPLALYRIELCRGLCCGMRDADDILEHVKARLGVEEGCATEDGRFHLSTSQCLGMCGTAPSMMVGDECYEELTVEKVDEILRNLGAKF
jgi:NADH-quinone oxidoreductase subunit E